MSSNPHLPDVFRQLVAEGGGAMEVHVLDAAAMLQIIEAALYGDRKAACMVTAVTDAARGIASAPRKQRKLCCSCPRTLHKPELMGVVSPACDEPSAALGFGFCSRCSVDQDRAVSQAIIVLQGMWPGIRILSAVGHA